MSDELEPEMRRLLDFERARPAPSSEVEQRVMARLTASMMAAPLYPEAPATPVSQPVAGLTLGGVKLMLFAAVCAGAGAALHSWLREADVRIVEVVRSVPAPEPVKPLEAPAKVTEQDPAPKVLPPPPEARPRSGPSPDDEAQASRARDRALAAERALLEQARTSLARQVPADALTALNEHAVQFPDGQLREEREGLQVLALFAAGEVERARASANAFRARYPQGVLLRAIRRAEEANR
jgi:hypothetical protein